MFSERLNTLSNMTLEEDAVEYLKHCRFSKSDVMNAVEILASVALNYAYYNAEADADKTAAFGHGLNKLIKEYCEFDTRTFYK